MEMYLIQTGKFRNKPKEEMEILGFSHIINLKEMFAAEFEMVSTYINGKQEFKNPLWLSLRRFIKERSNYTYIKVPDKKDVLGNEMYVYCKKEDEEEVLNAVKELLKKEYCKRPIGLRAYMQAKKEVLSKDIYDDSYICKYQNFWWDIENDVLMFFGKDKIDKIDDILDVMHEKWKDELFPKKTFLIKLREFFGKEKVG